MRASDECAVERETDVTGFQELDDFVFLALVFQVELVLVVEGSLGVLVDIKVDLVADFGHHVHLDVHVHDKIVVALPLLATRWVVAVGVFEAEGEVDGALWPDLNGVATEDGLKAFAADEHRWDDGVAVVVGACVLATTFFPIFSNPLTILVIEEFVFVEGGRGVVVEVANAADKGFCRLLRVRVYDVSRLSGKPVSGKFFCEG